MLILLNFLLSYDFCKYLNRYNQLYQQEKLLKAALKAEAVMLKKLEKENQKWEKGKLASKSIVAEIDTKVVEMGLVGGEVVPMSPSNSVMTLSC